MQDPHKLVLIATKMPLSVIGEITLAASRLGMDRSEFIRAACRRMVGLPSPLTPPPAESCVPSIFEPEKNGSNV